MANEIEPTKQEKKPVETPKQREAFLIYFDLGPERSIHRVYEEYAKGGKKLAEITLKQWSAKYSWVERVQKMDEEVAQRTEELAIKEATVKKSDILKAVKNTMIVFNRNMLAGSIVPTASDFKKMWEVMRIELGRNITDFPQEIPSINIAIINNEKVIRIVKEAQDKFREVLEAEIKEDE